MPDPRQETLLSDSSLEGQLESITYQNEENGYTVARLSVKGYREPVTIAGNFLAATPGEMLRLRGQWHNHPKYGPQFRVDSYEPVVPATAEGIERYLGSGLIKGIGPVTAKRIVDKFGLETIDIIENSVHRLREVGGMGEKRIRMVEAAWAEQREIKEVMLFLQSHGVSATYAAKIFRHYGRESVRTVKENPYRLATDIAGIGFISADRIAEKLGIVRDSKLRAEAGVLFVLGELSTEGHVFYPYEPLLEECEKVLTIGREVILKAIAGLTLQKKIVIADIGGREIKENAKAVYLSKFHASESGIADKLLRLLKAEKELRPFEMGKAIAWVEKEQGIGLSEKQKAAVAESVKSKVVVITGGPGTGKTTVINSIIRIYKRLGQSVVLAAPTGRAAKRMAEATGHEAKTIHRLLEYGPGGGFKRNESNPLSLDLMVVDEASMVDTFLMNQLLKAIPERATLILVGDADQLPSIGAGNVLNDVIASGKAPVIKLDVIFRQSGESLIVTNAHRVNRGEMPELNYDREGNRDFYFIEMEEPERILGEIIALCREKIPRRKFDPVRDIQVIAAMHRGVLGTQNLNAELQKALNHSKDILARGGRTYKRGDKVMQVVNNYDKDVYNGDIGTISRIDREEQAVTVDYDGTGVVYESRDLDEIALAYAVSVHKAQGSEYPAVIMPVHTQHFMLLQRNLLYTGISRGKRLVVLIGTRRAVAIAVRNDRPRLRYTNLKNMLGGAI